MKNSAYRVIVFDLGKVLLPFDSKIVIDNFNKIESGLGDRFDKLYNENYHVHQLFDNGKLEVDQFINTMLDWLEHKVSAEEFCNIYSKMFTVNQQMIELLPKLKENYKLVLLSNTNIIHKQYGWGEYDFLKYFDKQILSYEVGFSKPESEIFRAVEKFTNEKSDAHFYTDDILEYVEAAKLVGWDAVQFKGHDDFISALEIRSII
ncbi:MAG: HAD family phosphatase [Ignavibacteriales bacterium]|jgi:putative hydrolase of the HAD superfamily|nr:MAG: HAD family phosphatase [Ignavibacteriales bacterium]